MLTENVYLEFDSFTPEKNGWNLIVRNLIEGWSIPYDVLFECENEPHARLKFIYNKWIETSKLNNNPKDPTELFEMAFLHWFNFYKNYFELYREAMFECLQLIMDSEIVFSSVVLTELKNNILNESLIKFYIFDFNLHYYLINGVYWRIYANEALKDYFIFDTCIQREPAHYQAAFRYFFEYYSDTDIPEVYFQKIRTEVNFESKVIIFETLNEIKNFRMDLSYRIDDLLHVMDQVFEDQIESVEWVLEIPQIIKQVGRSLNEGIFVFLNLFVLKNSTNKLQAINLRVPDKFISK